MKIIHVEGTKGKGSTGTFTEEILCNYGFRTLSYLGAKGKFSCGFDINAFGGVHEGKAMTHEQHQNMLMYQVSIDILSDTLEGMFNYHGTPHKAARKLSVDAIDGLALSGGLEVAMAFHARIVFSTTQLGFPKL
ncbi:unnamed protein product [Lactuca virosa]|uniref:Uncharacterized protein n=1 Tax=Lactuca virosa TaxID=75947 RepID=A0AAU9NY53_9ASTR|nr:unnamed protein product [Lactuca virosa]